MHTAEQAREWIDAWAQRPSSKTWGWIREAIEETPESDREALLTHAEKAIEGWPAAMRDGSGDRSDRALSIHERWARQWPRTGALWRLVRSLKVDSVRALEDLPDRPVERLELPYGESILKAALAWPGYGQLRELSLGDWTDAPAGSLSTLLEALDSTLVRSVEVYRIGNHEAELVRALSEREWPALQGLTLARYSGGDLPRLLKSLEQSPLKWLRVDQRGFDDDVLEALFRAVGERVESLTLLAPLTTKQAELAGSCFPKLDSLTCRLTTGTISAFIGAATTDRLTALSSNTWGIDGASAGDELGALGHWEGAAGLRRLDIWDPSLSDAGLQALLASRNLDGLKVLKIRDSQITGEGLAAWTTRDPERTSLEEIRLEDNLELTGESVAQLCESPVAARLKVLEATEGAPNDSQIERIIKSKHLSGLRELNLSGTGLGKKAIARFLESPAVDGLEVLNLNYPKDKRRRLKEGDAFANAPGLARLRHLGLAGHRLYEHAFVEALAQSPHLKNLEELNLTDNTSDYAWEREDILEAREAGLPRLREVHVGAEV